MTALAGLFANNILPILIVAAAGYLLGRVLHVEPRGLTRVVFYVFSPCLLFDLMVRSQLSGGDALRMAGLATLVILSTGALALVLGAILGLERRLLIAVVLTAMFMNAGNYGLSLNLFAFGETALAHASLFFAASGVLSLTLGVLIASLGKMSPWSALSGLFKLPILYALVLALLVQRTGWTLPVPLSRTVALLAQAAIPAMLILLGLQLQRAEWNGRWRALSLSTGLRLIMSPLLAFSFSGLLGLQGAARQAGILETAMPTAVMTIVLATEYDLEPAFVTSAVFASTLLSPLTLTPLLAYLGA